MQYTYVEVAYRKKMLLFLPFDVFNEIYTESLLYAVIYSNLICIKTYILFI